MVPLLLFITCFSSLSVHGAQSDLFKDDFWAGLALSHQQFTDGSLLNTYEEPLTPHEKDPLFATLSHSQKKNKRKRATIKARRAAQAFLDYQKFSPLQAETLPEPAPCAAPESPHEASLSDILEEEEKTDEYTIYRKPSTHEKSFSLHLDYRIAAEETPMSHEEEAQRYLTPYGSNLLSVAAAAAKRAQELSQISDTPYTLIVLQEEELTKIKAFKKAHEDLLDEITWKLGISEKAITIDEIRSFPEYATLANFESSEEKCPNPLAIQACQKKIKRLQKKNEEQQHMPEQSLIAATMLLTEEDKRAEAEQERLLLEALDATTL